MVATLAGGITMVSIAVWMDDLPRRYCRRILDAGWIMPVNEAWHRANRMPPKATHEQRIEWHLEHAKECGCREIPAKLREEIKRGGLGLGQTPVEP